LAANVMKKSGAPHLAKIDDAALQQLPWQHSLPSLQQDQPLFGTAHLVVGAFSKSWNREFDVA
jgi:hypothetical protein